MAAKHLLPGYGGKYTSETLNESSTTGADTIDLSRCAQFMAQVIYVSGTPAGTLTMTNSVDGTNFVPLGSAIDVSTVTSTTSAISRYDVTDGPFGVIRIDATSMTGTGAVTVQIVGWPVQAYN